MTEITAGTVRFGFAAVYAVTFLVAYGLYRQTPTQLKRYSLTAVAVVGIGAPAIVLQEFGVGVVSVGNGTLDVLALGQAVFSTVVIYGLVLAAADVSQRLAVISVSIALIPTASGELVAIAGDGSGGILGAVVLALFLGSFFIPFPVLLYLFFGPVWQSATEAPAQQQLLHWKARNILLFTYGMLLVYTPLVLSGVLTDPVLDAFVQEYSVFFLYGGIVLYLLYNYSTLSDGEATNLSDSVSKLSGGDLS